MEVYGSQLDNILETQYQGLYILTEKIKRSQDWISGDYILKMDKESPGDVSITTNSGQKVISDSPSGVNVKPDQKAYIQDLFNRFEDRVLNPVPGVPESFGEFIDLDSFADILLVYEALGIWMD